MNEYFFAFLFLLRRRTKFNNKEHFRSYKWIIFYFCCCFCYYCCCFMILCLFCRRAGVRSFVQSKIIFSVYVLYICFIICIFFCYDCFFYYLLFCFTYSVIWFLWILKLAYYKTIRQTKKDTKPKRMAEISGNK